MEKKLQDTEIMKALKGMEIPWEASKEEVWQNLEQSIQSREVKVHRMSTSVWIRLAAALVVVLVSSGLFMRFFERQVACDSGEHLTHQLPDGSTVELNSGSSISYHPFWWRLSRSLDFEGEAFFQVQKGKRFVVESERANTQVLGTSFTIYSRDADYRVVCHTGKVQVRDSNSDQSAFLLPNQIAQLQANGRFELKVKEVLPDPTPWKSRIFEYRGTNLNEVIEEIERQYDVLIHSTLKRDYSYTGSIQIDRDFLTTLNLVCKPFKITFVKIAEGEYQIVENPGAEE